MGAKCIITPLVFCKVKLDATTAILCWQLAMLVAIGKLKIHGENPGEKMATFAFNEEEAAAAIWAFLTPTLDFPQSRHHHRLRRRHRHRHHQLPARTLMVGGTKMVTHATPTATTITALRMEELAVVGIPVSGEAFMIGMTARGAQRWMHAVVVVVVPP